MVLTGDDAVDYCCFWADYASSSPLNVNVLGSMLEQNLLDCRAGTDRTGPYDPLNLA